MITAKFGGTAMTPSNLRFLKQCLTPNHQCVVVSAIGREYPNDVKATDLLKQYYLTRDEGRFDAFADKYRRLVTVNGIDVDVDKLLFDVRNRALKFDLDYCMSLGEETSAKVTAKYLNAAYIEAEQIVRFGRRKLRYNDTVAAISQAFDGVGLAVTGGFYGGCNLSRKVFSRGGSDITGSLCAVALNSALYENWTDSYGVCVANPAKVFDVSTVPNLSYDEMYTLSRAGAEVLHPDAVKPCQGRGIPIKIGNFYNPYGQSTLISNSPSNKAVLSIAERQNASGNIVTTVLHNLDKRRIASVFADFLQDNYTTVRVFGKAYTAAHVDVISFACEGSVAAITTNKSIICFLYKHLKSSGLID